MVSRKSRSRKTADKMARYKEDMQGDATQGSRSSTARRSPRGKIMKEKGFARTRSSPARSTDSRGGTRGKDPCDDDANKKSETDGTGFTRLECAFEIPETPPRQAQVVGRKRALAPEKLRFGEEEGNPDTDSQMPSKKRKAFNTPPRAEGAVRKATATATAKDSTLLPESSVERDHEHEEILDMEIFGDADATAAAEGKESDQIHRDWVFGTTKRRTAPAVAAEAREVEGNNLEFISVSMEALTRTLDSFKNKVVEEMRGLYRRQKSELQEYNESVLTPLVSEVRDMRSVVELMSNGGKNSSSGKSCSKTSLNEWEQKLNQLTPKVDVVFTKQVFARILCFNGPLKVCEVFDGFNRNAAGKASAAVQTLLWGHQPGGKKGEFSEGLGKLHSEFKYVVVKNIFFNVCKQDTFDLFRSPLVAEDSGTKSGSHCRIDRPDWLAANYVSVDHINEARSFMESVNQSRKSKVRETASPDDIATHGALRVYRLLGAHLHKGRDYMRTRFFQDLGYLFVPWKDYVTNNDQKKMKMWFTADVRESPLTLDNVPFTALCPFAAGVDKYNHVHAANRKLVKNLCSEWPGLVLHVQHDVHVTQGAGAQRRRTGGERKPLYRLINLIEVACDVVVEYTRVGSLDLLLRGHKKALRCIMVFAHLIRDLTKEFIAMRAAMEPTEGDPDKTVPDPLDVVVHDTCLKVFLPGKTVQENYLSSRCLRLTEGAYCAYNEGDERAKELENTRSGGGVFEVTAITESEELGVAAI